MSYFDWHPSRAPHSLLDFLGYNQQTNTIAYQGDIQTDGYIVYETVAAQHGLRRARSRPIADQLHRLLTEANRQHLPGSDVAKAIRYTLGQWHKIILCFEDGALEFDTNLVENIIRATKLGMKNCRHSVMAARDAAASSGSCGRIAARSGDRWIFFGSLEAGTNNALLYTLLANCRIQGMDPEDYLIEVLKRLPPNASAAQAAPLTPRHIAAERKARAATQVA